MNGIRGLWVCAILLGAVTLGAIPAPAAQSFYGYSGLLLTPTTEVTPQGGFSLGGYFINPDRGGNTAVFAGEAGLYPKLELGLAVAKPENGDSDLQINAKYRFLAETTTAPAIAVGVFGLASNADSTVYAVVGKSLTPFTGGGAPSIYAGFAGGGSIDGLFGGVSLPLGEKLTLLLEHDTHDFNFGARFAITPQLRLHGGAFGSNAVGLGLSFYASY